MPYCLINDIRDQISEDVLIQLTDDSDVGLTDEQIVTRAIADADGQIDGYCGKRYSVPFAPVPPIIRKFSVDIAIYNLYGRRKGAPESRRDRYKEAVDFLKGVAKGHNTLGVDDPDSTPSDTHKPEISSSGRIFSRDKFTGF